MSDLEGPPHISELNSAIAFLRLTGQKCAMCKGVCLGSSDFTLKVTDGNGRIVLQDMAPRVIDIPISRKRCRHSHWIAAS